MSALSNQSPCRHLHLPPTQSMNQNSSFRNSNESPKTVSPNISILKPKPCQMSDDRSASTSQSKKYSASVSGGIGEMLQSVFAGTKSLCTTSLHETPRNIGPFSSSYNCDSHKSGFLNERKFNQTHLCSCSSKLKSNGDCHLCVNVQQEKSPVSIDSEHFLTKFPKDERGGLTLTNNNVVGATHAGLSAESDRFKELLPIENKLV